MSEVFLFNERDFAPGEVLDNKLRLDPDLPPAAQADLLEEDLVWVEFPNGVHLGIGWYPMHRPSGKFAVEVTQDPEAYEPFFKRRCRSLAKLRLIVREAVKVAAARPSIRRPVFEQGTILGASIDLNELILDHAVPLEQQLDALGELMLEVRFVGTEHILTIGWIPPHAPSGEFVVSLKTGAESAHDDGEPQKFPKTIEDRRCRSIAELKAIVEELAQKVVRDNEETGKESG